MSDPTGLEEAVADAHSGNSAEAQPLQRWEQARTLRKATHRPQQC